MIKQSCRHCKSSKSVDKAIVGKSIKLQASVAKTGEDFAGKPERRDKIRAVRDSAEYSDLVKVNGLDSLSEKKTDPEEGSPYIVCSNAQHLEDEGAENGIVHKYYFKCPHFAAKE